MRDFEYDPKAIKAEREAKKKLEDELKKQFVSAATSEYFHNTRELPPLNMHVQSTIPFACCGTFPCSVRLGTY